MSFSIKNGDLIPIFERLEIIESLIRKIDNPNLMTIKDLVKYSRLSEPTIRRSIMRGTLSHSKKMVRSYSVEPMSITG
jgi:hypothetical protein